MPDPDTKTAEQPPQQMAGDLIGGNFGGDQTGQPPSGFTGLRLKALDPSKTGYDLKARGGLWAAPPVRVQPQPMLPANEAQNQQPTGVLPASYVNPNFWGAVNNRVLASDVAPLAITNLAWLIHQALPFFGGTAEAAERRGDNPEDMFTAQQNLERNQQFAKPGPYITPLTPQEQPEFNAWLKTGQQGGPVNWNAKDLSYDMPGYWKAMKAGDPEAKGELVQEDKDRHGKPRYHYPDKWKTPYEATFSNGSMYAQPNAPQWVQVGKEHWQYRLGDHVIFDDVEKRWHGLPRTKD